MRRRDAIGLLASGVAPGVVGIVRGENAGLTAPPLQRPLRADSITNIGGFGGVRFRLNARVRLSHFDIDSYVRMVERRRYRDWKWIGEQPGKWLEAAILASGTFHDDRLQEKAASILRRMVAAQEPSGYLGITDPAVRTSAHPLRGMDAYELYFTLHALLTAHDEWGSAPALEAAARLGDYFVNHIGPGKAEFWPAPPETTIAGHAGHRGLEGTLLIDPMMRLYQSTGEPKYLKWSKWVVENIDPWSGCGLYSNLDKVARGEMGVNRIAPKVHAHTLHMNLLGLLRLYQATGEESYFRKVLGAWRDIVAKRVYITGGVSYKEYYRGDFELPNGNEGVETCAVMSWIQLNQALLGITGNPAHADAIEKALWNHAFATQTWDGDGFRYGVPMSGWKPGLNFTGPNCCSGSGARLLALLPAFVYGRGRDGIYVNQFLDSRARVELPSGGSVDIEQRTRYPEDERVALEILPKTAERFTLHIRVPAWCGAPRLSVNGERVDGARPGTYAKLDRTWHPGDRVELRLPMEARWARGSHGNEGLQALTRGPVVYVLDSVWQSEPVRAQMAAGAAGDPIATPSLARSTEKLTAAAPPDAALGPFYRGDIRFRDGSTAAAEFSPFANLGRWYPGDAKRPSTLPDPTSRLFPFAVWLPS